MRILTNLFRTLTLFTTFCLDVISGLVIGTLKIVVSVIISIVSCLLGILIMGIFLILFISMMSGYFLGVIGLFFMFGAHFSRIHIPLTITHTILYSFGQGFVAHFLYHLFFCGGLSRFRGLKGRFTDKTIRYYRRKRGKKRLPQNKLLTYQPQKSLSPRDE